MSLPEHCGCVEDKSHIEFNENKDPKMVISSPENEVGDGLKGVSGFAKGKKTEMFWKTKTPCCL